MISAWQLGTVGLTGERAERVAASVSLNPIGTQSETSAERLYAEALNIIGAVMNLAHSAVTAGNEWLQN